MIQSIPSLSRAYLREATRYTVPLRAARVNGRRREAAVLSEAIGIACWMASLAAAGSRRARA